MTRLLMCPPTYYGIEYEINPWMKKEHPADHEKAEMQWNELYETLISLPDVEIELIEPQKGLPDMVFTANAGLVSGDLFIPSRFRHAERRPEAPHFEKWFAERGYRIHHLPKDMTFEGAGDILKAGDVWFGGYYFRSGAQAIAAVSAILQEEVLPLRLIDPWFYHLDTCFAPVGRNVAYYPGAFDEYARTVIEAHFPRAIEVAENEARVLGCNLVTIGQDVILGAGCIELCARLESLEFRRHPIDLSEFIKAGGSARCLTLNI